jgi:hypothetical protein
VSGDVLVAMVGTRTRVQVVCDDVTRTLESLDRQTIIVTGDAPGTDYHVRKECDRLGFRYIECHARKVEGKWAGRWVGPERNTLIARLAHRAIGWPAVSEEECLATGVGTGTWNCLSQFVDRKKPIDVRRIAWEAVR